MVPSPRRPARCRVRTAGGDALWPKHHAVLARAGLRGDEPCAALEDNPRAGSDFKPPQLPHVHDGNLGHRAIVRTYCYSTYVHGHCPVSSSDPWRNPVLGIHYLVCRKFDCGATAANAATTSGFRATSRKSRACVRAARARTGIGRVSPPRGRRPTIHRIRHEVRRFTTPRAPPRCDPAIRTMSGGCRAPRPG